MKAVNTQTHLRSPEFVLMSPDLPSAVTHFMKPFAAAGHVRNVDVAQHGETQDVL